MMLFSFFLAFLGLSDSEDLWRKTVHGCQQVVNDSMVTRMEILKLYKQLLRESSKCSSYNFRFFEIVFFYNFQKFNLKFLKHGICSHACERCFSWKPKLARCYSCTEIIRLKWQICEILTLTMLYFTRVYSW